MRHESTFVLRPTPGNAMSPDLQTIAVQLLAKLGTSLRYTPLLSADYCGNPNTEVMIHIG